MENTTWVIILVGLVILGLLGFYSFPPKSREEVKISEITVKKVEATRVAAINEQGPYEEMGKVLAELYGWLSDKGIQPAGPPFGIFYDDPSEVAPEKLRYKICFPLSQNIQGDDRIKIETIPAIEAASIIHKGPYSEVGPAWEKLSKWIEKEGYQWAGAGREIYLNDPENTPEDELLTEIQIPVKK